ncbi:MAG: response regulator, partial [Mariprofundus sp.]
FLDSHPQLKGVRLARLSVKDNGCGIEQESLTHIFDPFYSTKEVGKGTGLGLSMVYGAVERHHGLILAESRVGKGAVFHLYLPLIEQSAPLEQLAPIALSEGKQETILLVDDQETLRTTMAEVLEELGYAVIEAADGEQALALFHTHHQRIRLVVTDIMMPKMNGVELMTKIYGFSKAMPVIFVTGYDKTDLFMDDIAIEHSMVLSKPYSIEDLCQGIQTMLSMDRVA